MMVFNPASEESRIKIAARIREQKQPAETR